MNIKRFKVKLILLSTLILSACNYEITDFFEAMQDYGYHLEKPLSPNNTKINEDYLGAYVYKQLPLVIVEQNPTTYRIDFLTTSIYKEDRSVEAHLTKLGEYEFLNINMGGYYTVIRPVVEYESYLSLALVRGAMEEHFNETALKTYLRKFGNKEKYAYQDDEGYDQETSVYYTFSFEKITREAALKIQEEELYKDKIELYADCRTVYEFQRNAEYFPPDDELTLIGHESILNNCRNEQDVLDFIDAFPNSPVISQAYSKVENYKKLREEKENFTQDSLMFSYAEKENTIEAYQEFLENRKTEVFANRAQTSLINLAKKISNEDIEWKFTNGNIDVALQYIFYKIDYGWSNQIDAEFLVQNMSYYCLVQNDEEWTKKVLEYMNLLQEKGLNGDALLDLYLERGFVLWSLNNTSSARNSFKAKKDEVYQRDGLKFKKALKSRYKFYTGEGISFPDESSNWKVFKKLK